MDGQGDKCGGAGGWGCWFFSGIRGEFVTQPRCLAALDRTPLGRGPQVGDRLDTDVVFGNDNGCTSCLTLSGVTSEAKYLSPRSPPPPHPTPSSSQPAGAHVGRKCKRLQMAANHTGTISVCVCVCACACVCVLHIMHAHAFTSSPLTPATRGAVPLARR